MSLEYNGLLNINYVNSKITNDPEKHETHKVLKKLSWNREEKWIHEDLTIINI
jgi:hypothetical protein